MRVDRSGLRKSTLTCDACWIFCRGLLSAVSAPSRLPVVSVVSVVTSRHLSSRAVTGRHGSPGSAYPADCRPSDVLTPRASLAPPSAVPVLHGLRHSQGRPTPCRHRLLFIVMRIPSAPISCRSCRCDNDTPLGER